MEIIESKKNMLIVRNSNTMTFYSYGQKVAEYNADTKKMLLFTIWSYSQTTAKQFKHFINTYTCFEYTTKKEFQKVIKSNQNINEVIKLI